MEIRYLYLPDIQSSNIIPEREYRHLKVLRIKNGDVVRIIDGKGSLYEAVIYNNTVRDLKVLIQKERPFDITLVLGLIKPQRLDFLLQKVCEIGLSRIIFVYMYRSNVNLSVYLKKEERMRKIIVDALKQSHNLFLPELVFVDSLNRAVESLNGFKICFYEKAKFKLNFSTINPSTSISFLVGPEGGITKNEVDFLTKEGFLISKLSNSILRTETAAIYALSILNYSLS